MNRILQNFIDLRFRAHFLLGHYDVVHEMFVYDEAFHENISAN